MRNERRCSSAKSRKFRRLFGGRHKLAPHIQTTIEFCDFAESCLCSFSTYHSQTWQSYPDFKVLFPQGLERYSRDPGFGQNTVRDSGKRKIS